MSAAALWPEANAKWKSNWSGTVSLGAGLIGSDGAASIDLGGGRTAWTPGDSFVATAAGQTRRQGAVVRNCLVLQTGGAAPYDLSDAGTVLTTYTGGTAGAPTEFFPMEAKDGSPHWHWPNNGLMVDGKLVLVAYRMEPPFRTAGHSLYVIDNPGDVPTAWNLPRFDTLVHSDPRFIIGGPLIDDGDSWIYLSAFQQGGASYMARVARTEIGVGRVTQPQWWRMNSAWSYDDPELVGALYSAVKRQEFDSTSLSPHLTVTKRASDYLEVTHRGNPVNLAYGASATKTGPFTLTNVFQPPESTQQDTSGRTFQVYNGKAHPEQTWSGKGANDCLLGYAVNSNNFDAFDPVGSAIYWPTMVKATALV